MQCKRATQVVYACPGGKVRVKTRVPRRHAKTCGITRIFAVSRNFTPYA